MPSLVTVFSSEVTVLARSWAREIPDSATFLFKSEKSNGARSGLCGGVANLFCLLLFLSFKTDTESYGDWQYCRGGEGSCRSVVAIGPALAADPPYDFRGRTVSV